MKNHIALSSTLVLSLFSGLAWAQSQSPTVFVEVPVVLSSPSSIDVPNHNHLPTHSRVVVQIGDHGYSDSFPLIWLASRYAHSAGLPHRAQVTTFGPDDRAYFLVTSDYDPPFSTRLVSAILKNEALTEAKVIATGLTGSGGLVWKNNVLFVSDTRRVHPARPYVTTHLYKMDRKALSLERPVDFRRQGSIDAYLFEKITVYNPTNEWRSHLSLDRKGNLYTTLSDGSVHQTKLDKRNQNRGSSLVAEGRRLTYDLDWTDSHEVFYHSSRLSAPEYGVGEQGKAPALESVTDGNEPIFQSRSKSQLGIR